MSCLLIFPYSEKDSAATRIIMHENKSKSSSPLCNILIPGELTLLLGAMIILFEGDVTRLELREREGTVDRDGGDW